MTRKIYSYILRHDSGAAPNPFWDICTLTICKPAIRRTADVGDWVIGTGSKNAKVTKDDIIDISDNLVYAMKVTDKKSLEAYNKFCNENFQNKIPRWKTNDWHLRLGDCIYDYPNDSLPILRKSVHQEKNKETDLSGKFALLSNHFYYFGLAAKQIPNNLKQLIKHGPGHKIIYQEELIDEFENWISQFQANTIFADPQLRWLFDKGNAEEIVLNSSQQDYEDDKDETCETYC